MIRTLLVVAALLCAFVTTAEARPKSYVQKVHISTGCSDPVMHPCEKPVQNSRKYSRIIPAAVHRVADAGKVIGSRPAGCPRAYCGCGASLYLFGKIIPSLNLAANWLRFPRATPAPGMAAARRGHVFVLKRHIAGKTWLVMDANSGGGKTRLHPRSIAGFQIVDPRGSRLVLR